MAILPSRDLNHLQWTLKQWPLLQIVQARERNNQAHLQCFPEADPQKQVGSCWVSIQVPKSEHKRADNEKLCRSQLRRRGDLTKYVYWLIYAFISSKKSQNFGLGHHRSVLFLQVTAVYRLQNFSHRRHAPALSSQLELLPFPDYVLVVGSVDGHEYLVVSLLLVL